MDYCELKDQVNGLDERQRKGCTRVLSLVSIGGGMRPEFREHLDGASTYREFFEALYGDDTLRFTKAWAAWARHDGKQWVDRFEPAQAAERVPFAGRGLPVEFSGNTVLVPLGGHGKKARVLAFEDGAFNEDAAAYFTSIEGAFTCGGLSFDGIYDVFTSGNTVLFEHWALNEKGIRVKSAQLAENYGLTG
ncbi:hypothetical protein C1878_03645 [Gordonibacter sp. 28C]|uniref:hypothetical protein n=1 Tax=Gordonibacter sp. 28C TaxID=2078569 RepID=UPI000DF75DA5|nr:hypothetical protein [Gordonibacter sp. 28C]RDB63895.1 hypothetical protein C1878_03645 [Gordonibacter sp. 28C]